MQTTAADGDYGETDREFTAYKAESMARIDHPGGFRAAFDLTSFEHGGAAQQFLADIGVLGGDDLSGDLVGLEMPHDEPAYYYLWQNDDLVMSTTVNPVTGERAENQHGEETVRHDPERKKGYCGYIHLIGEETAVRDAAAAIERRAIHVKGRSIGEWRF